LANFTAKLYCSLFGGAGEPSRKLRSPAMAVVQTKVNSATRQTNKHALLLITNPLS
jgi:hypothetical protein